jgi:hypothetical protein
LPAELPIAAIAPREWLFTNHQRQAVNGLRFIGQLGWTAGGQLVKSIADAETAAHAWFPPVTVFVSDRYMSMRA